MSSKQLASDGLTVIKNVGVPNCLIIAFISVFFHSQNCGADLIDLRNRRASSPSKSSFICSLSKTIPAVASTYSPFLYTLFLFNAVSIACLNLIPVSFLYANNNHKILSAHRLSYLLTWDLQIAP